MKEYTILWETNRKDIPTGTEGSLLEGSPGTYALAEDIRNDT